MRLKDRIVIVTGAASGIGAACVTLFRVEGATVIGVDIKGADHDADVSDVAASARVADAVLAAHGRIDGLVTAAGMSFGKRLIDASEVEFDRVFAVNVKGTAFWIKAVLPHMIARRRGAIVTLASQLALAGGKGNAAYVASKGAVISLTRSVALDHAVDGVRANAVLPGATETPMLARAFARAPDPQAARAASRARHAMGRFGEAEEIARAALFLLSDEASFITGAALPVEGGWLVA